MIRVTPLELLSADACLIRERIGVVAERMVLELQGVQCLRLEQVTPEPWSVLKMSGLPWRARASSSVSTQNAASIVVETRHDSTRRLNQSSTAAR